MEVMPNGRMNGRGLITGSGVGALITGISILISSRSITVEDLGAFEWYWVFLVGLVISSLGLTTILSVRAREAGDEVVRAFLAMVLASAVLLFMGSVMLIFTSPIEIEGIGGARGFWLGLVGLWLLLLGTTIALVSAADRLIGARLGGLGATALMCDAIILTAGLGIIGFAGPLTIGAVSFSERTVIIIGAQLLVLGLLHVVLIFRLGRERRRSRLDRLAQLVMALVAIEGVAVVIMADAVTLGPYALSMEALVILGFLLTAVAILTMFCTAFSQISDPRGQGTAFALAVMFLILAPIAAILAHSI